MQNEVFWIKCGSPELQEYKYGQHLSLCLGHSKDQDSLSHIFRLDIRRRGDAGIDDCEGTILDMKIPAPAMMQNQVFNNQQINLN